MLLTIITDFGIVKVDTENFDAFSAPTSHPLFMHVENSFETWFEHHTQPGAPMGRDIKEMYDSWESIYERRDAIRAGIEIVIEYAIENNVSFISKEGFMLIDVECAFEC